MLYATFKTQAFAGRSERGAPEAAGGRAAGNLFLYHEMVPAEEVLLCAVHDGQAQAAGGIRGQREETASRSKGPQRCHQLHLLSGDVADRKEPAGINRIGNEGSYKGKPSFLFGRAETGKPVKKPTGGAILN